MIYKMKRIVNKYMRVMLAVLLCFAVLLCGCQQSNKESESKTITTSKCGVLHDTESGGVFIKITIDEFNKLGFRYGDSVDISFSNGYELKDIPYFNGYYTKPQNPLLTAYHGDEYIKAAIYCGDDLWTSAGINDTDTAAVKLREKGKYLDIQESDNISYENSREKFKSDEQFANFRSINVKNLRKNYIYRSASPCDNVYNRASYVDKLISKAGVKFVVNLADNDGYIKEYMSDDGFDSPYFKSLFDDNKVLAVSMDTNYTSDEFRKKAVEALTAIARNDGPMLIHCVEGKDRTGFVCMLLEAFVGASYDEIVNDYMVTYDNYYGINKKSDSKRYKTIVENSLNPMIETIVANNKVDYKKEPLSKYAENYLKAGGMKSSVIKKLRENLKQ